MAYKNVVIEPYPGGVSASLYDNFSTSQKNAYHTALVDLNSNTYENARWILSYEVYIPSGRTIQIPQNVILVANGGLFSGTGNIIGNMTQILSDFEQIFEATVQFPGIDSTPKTNTWDVTESSPEWFGTASITTDCSTKIQKAIDLINYGNGDLYPNDTGFYTRGGKVICKPLSRYLISNPIYLQVGHSFDGGNSNFIYGLTINSSDADANFMFRINFKKGERTNHTPTIQKAGQLEIISNIRIINPNLTVGARGIYSGSQICTFENIYTDYLYQTFKRHTVYSDQISIKNFLISRSRKSGTEGEYQIDMGYIGDALLVDNVHMFIESTSVANDKLLKINACGSGVVQRLINGSIYIIGSKSLILQAIHQEFGNITTVNSQVEINNWCHFKKPNVPALVNSKRSSSYENRQLSLKNVMILYNHKLNNFSSSQIDIEVGTTSLVKFENVTRCAQQDATEASSLYGVNVNHQDFQKNIAMHSLNSLISGKQSVNLYDRSVVNDLIGYQLPIANVLNSEIYPTTGSAITNTYLPDTTTYQYYASIVLDAERNLGYDYTSHKPAAVNVVANSTRMVIIQFIRPVHVGLTIRLFKKKGNSSTIYYLDLPVCMPNNAFYDIGNTTLFGEQWKTTTAPTLTNVTSYFSAGDNVIVSMASAPSSGIWQEGDIINLPDRQLIYGKNFSLE
jgi:hypothetical protein